jgi:2-C-methyl-D-erythritol 4-phosphate cytidylyltransferase
LFIIENNYYLYINIKEERMVFAIILAGGNSSRMNSAITKQRMTVCGKPVIWHTVRAFEKCASVDKILVVAKEDEQDYMKSELSEFDKLYGIVTGGATRAESSYRGLLAVPAECTMVAIHDAARCLITPDGISAVLDKARFYGAATAAMKVSDTVKRIDELGNIIDTIDRGLLTLVQTPQVFNYCEIMDAFSLVDMLDDRYTDDNMIYERAGGRICTVDIGRDNIKITEPRDILLAELILKERGNV